MVEFNEDEGLNFEVERLYQFGWMDCSQFVQTFNIFAGYFGQCGKDGV